MKHLVPKFLGFVLLTLLALPLLSSCVTQRAMRRTFTQWYVAPAPRTLEEAQWQAHQARMRRHSKNKFR